MPGLSAFGNRLVMRLHLQLADPGGQHATTASDSMITLSLLGVRAQISYYLGYTRAPSITCGKASAIEPNGELAGHSVGIFKAMNKTGGALGAAWCGCTGWVYQETPPSCGGQTARSNLYSEGVCAWTNRAQPLRPLHGTRGSRKLLGGGWAANISQDAGVVRQRHRRPRSLGAATEAQEPPSARSYRGI